jgi:hypothetical protein
MPFGPFSRQGLCCPAGKVTFANSEGIFENFVEDFGAFIAGQDMLFREDVYADPLFMGPSMRVLIMRRHCNDASER